MTELEYQIAYQRGVVDALNRVAYGYETLVRHVPPSMWRLTIDTAKFWRSEEAKARQTLKELLHQRKERS